MCGIAGIIDSNGLGTDILPVFEICVNSLNHRGPDGIGIFIDDFAALGHTRLSIIDPAGGFQPICNEDKSLWLVCNGEIFNYIEIRADLEKNGHRLSTHTDIEVLLHLYEDYGENMFDYINGQFAFAIWDSVKKNIFLARDHVGICPLYYSRIHSKFIFASEAKAILQTPWVKPRLDYHALAQTFTFWAPLPGNSLFESIFEVKPGHFMRVSENGLIEKPWWEINYPEPEKYITDVKKASEELIYLLEDSVRLRLRADVPVGAYLSGGLDSSITTSLVKTRNNNQLRTFSIGFEESEYDESFYQKLVSGHLNTDHSAIKCDNATIINVLDKVVWHAEKPVLRTAPAPLFLLSKAVRENGYKVVLTGEGADEFFSGYNIYKETKVRCFNARQPLSVTRPKLFSKIYPYITADPRTLKFWQGFFQKGLQNLDDPYYSHRLRWENGHYISSFLNADITSSLLLYNPVFDLDTRLNGKLRNKSPLTRAHFLEAFIFLSSYLLSTQGDRMLMGHAVEGRFPFLDTRVIEFANKLAPQLKMKGLDEKWILKKAFSSMLPEPVIKRNKQPYRAPVSKSLYANKTKAGVWKSELNSGKNSIFDDKKVMLLFKKLEQSGNLSARDEMALMAVISTHLLYEQYVNANPPVAVHIRKSTIIDNRISN